MKRKVIAIASWYKSKKKQVKEVTWKKKKETKQGQKKSLEKRIKKKECIIRYMVYEKRPVTGKKKIRKESYDVVVPSRIIKTKNKNKIWA